MKWVLGYMCSCKYFVCLLSLLGRVTRAWKSYGLSERKSECRQARRLDHRYSLVVSILALIEIPVNGALAVYTFAEAPVSPTTELDLPNGRLGRTNIYKIGGVVIRRGLFP